MRRSRRRAAAPRAAKSPPPPPTFALVRLGESHVIDRIAVAGRYAPEFDAIGNNLQALRELAGASGGAVIEPAQTTPIDFHWPVRSVALGTYCSVAGAMLV